MRYIKEDFLNDPAYEVWRNSKDSQYEVDVLVKKIEELPEKYVVNITTCGECENYDDSWTSNDVGYCTSTDCFWFPYESCSRGENKNIVTKRSITRC